MLLELSDPLPFAFSLPASSLELSAIFSIRISTYFAIRIFTHTGFIIDFLGLFPYIT